MRESGILLFKTSSKHLCHDEGASTPTGLSTNSKRKPRIVYKGIDASQILFEAKHFLILTPADVEVSLDQGDAGRRRGHRRRRRTRKKCETMTCLLCISDTQEINSLRRLREASSAFDLAIDSLSLTCTCLSISINHCLGVFPASTALHTHE